MLAISSGAVEFFPDIFSDQAGTRLCLLNAGNIRVLPDDSRGLRAAHLPATTYLSIDRHHRVIALKALG